MKRFIKTVLFIIILMGIFGWLYLYPGKIKFTLWGGYEVYSSIFSIALVILCLAVLCYILRIFKGIYNVVFNRINLNHALSKYIKRIELSNPIDKEIQLCLTDEIKDLRTLRLVYYLNGLICKKNYSKALKVIRKKENKTKLKNILNYAKVEILLAEGLKKEAVEVCKVFLNSNRNATWAFLKLFNITLIDNDNSNLVYLNNFLLHNRVNLSEDAMEKAYCLINYKLCEQEYNTNAEAMYKRVNMLIRRYPKFTPSYILLTRYLISVGKKEEAIKVLAESWKHNITYENSILISNIFTIENKDAILNEVKHLLKSNKYKNKENTWLLLCIIYSSYGEYININDILINVKNTNSSLYKLTILYILLKENNLKDEKSIVSSFSQSLPLNWWNEYLKVDNKSQ